MKIDPNGPVRPLGPHRDIKRKSGGNFADSLTSSEAETESPRAAGGAPALAAVDALFALQAVPDAAGGRSRGLMRADTMLERLDDLRVGLILGHVGRDKLADLARLAREGSGEVADPQLREVLQEIELRAEVELAKLGL